MSAALSLSPAVGVDHLAHGLHRGVHHDAYHVRTLGMASHSALTRVKRSPAHYLAWVMGASDEDSAALQFGRQSHCAILEPECFERTHVVVTDFGDCRFKANKTARDAWRADNAGKEEVTPENWARIEGIAASVRRHPRASKLLREGEAEVTVRWRDPATGLECKCRADWLVERLGMIVDLKSAEDARTRPFANAAARYGYAEQAGFYRSGFAALGIPIKHWAFLVYEKEPPFAIKVYTLRIEDAVRGYESVRRSMGTLAECLRTNVWPAYTEEIEELELPPWAG